MCASVSIARPFSFSEYGFVCVLKRISGSSGADNKLAQLLESNQRLNHAVTK